MRVPEPSLTARTPTPLDRCIAERHDMTACACLVQVSRHGAWTPGPDYPRPAFRWLLPELWDTARP